MIRQYQKKIDWSLISWKQNLSEAFIREHQDKLAWGFVSSSQTLSENFIREFQDKVDWPQISQEQQLSEDFIREFKDKVYWSCIASSQVLSEGFIEEFQDYIEDESLLYQSDFTLAFIKKYLHKFNLPDLVVMDEFSEESLREISENFKNPLDDPMAEWYAISRYRTNLSLSFLKDFEDRIVWTEQSEKYMSEEILKVFKHKIVWRFVLGGNMIKVTEPLVMEVLDALSIYDLKLILGIRTKDNVLLQKDRKIQLCDANREILEKRLAELIAKKKSKPKN